MEVVHLAAVKGTSCKKMSDSQKCYGIILNEIPIINISTFSIGPVAGCSRSVANPESVANSIRLGEFDQFERKNVYAYPEDLDSCTFCESEAKSGRAEFSEREKERKYWAAEHSFLWIRFTSESTINNPG
jgi:hypothetical protein